MVKVFISFATEDFVTPGMDDMHLEIARLLSKRGICGCFHVTGEVARAWRVRRRKDVIDALKRHEIGYHGNTHGAFPFLGSVCEDNTWDDAVAEILRTEALGVADVAEVFGGMPRYFVLEFVKAPQLIDAIRSLGIDLIGYSTLPKAQSPFVWFARSLCFNGLLDGLELPHDRPNRVKCMTERFDSLHAAAQRGEGDGVIKLFLHPYKLLYDWREQSWGARLNDAYKDYKFMPQDWAAPATHGAAEVRRLVAEFDEVLRHVLSKPDVEFVSTCEAAAPYRGQPDLFLDTGEFLGALGSLRDGFGQVRLGRAWLSPGEVFAMLVSALSHYAEAGRLPGAVPFRTVLGPVEEAPENAAPASVRVSTLWRELPRVERELDFRQRLPASLTVRGKTIAPGAALTGMAELARRILESGEAPPQAVFGPVPDYPAVAAEDYFQETTFTHGDLYPEGFTGAGVCRHCRLQSWSYKPASRGA